MTDEKDRIASLLVKARADLDDALFEMEKLLLKTGVEKPKLRMSCLMQNYLL